MDDDVLMTIIAEALGEGPEGMRRVGETILNRAAIRGLTPEQVVRQPAQYTGFSAPGPAARQAQKDPRAITAAEAAWELARRPGDPTEGADHYHADYVSPYWADDMPSTGSYGQHQFYKSQPVPQEALARLLMPESRNVPLPRNRPASPLDQIAQMFAGSFDGSGQRADTAAGLDEYVSRPRAQTIPGNHMVFGTGINDAHQRGQAATKQTSINDLAAALEQMMPNRVASSGPSDPVSDGPSRSFFEEIFNTSLSGIGQSPSTRTVQSVPVPQRRAAPPQMTTAQARADNGQNRPVANTRKAPLTIGAAPSYAAMDAARPTNASEVGNMPAFSDLAMMFGTTPQPAGSTNNRKDQSRLAENDVWTVGEDERMAMHGMDGPTQLANVTLPTSASQRPQQPQQNRVAVTQKPVQRSVTMPTPAGQRPAAAARIAPPVIAARQPLRVVVKAEPPKINPANHNIEQLRAALSGRSSYSPAGGGPSMPVYAMNGKLRNSYGDSGSTGSGGSLV